jgi:hypothetical protein
MTMETLTTRLNDVNKHLTDALDENLELTREIDRLKKEFSARDSNIARTERPSLGERKGAQVGTKIGVLVQRDGGGVMAVTDLGPVTLLNQNVTGPGEDVNVPEGWRDLNVGEKKMVGDRFLADDGKWTEVRPEHLGFEDYVSRATRPVQRNVLTCITPSNAGDQAASMPEPTREDAIATLVELGETEPVRDDVDMLYGGLQVYHEILSNKRKSAATDWVNIIEDNCWDLRCTSEPTGGDDSEVLWHVIQHHMAEPHERTIASDLNLTKALQRALNPQMEQDDV